MPPMKIAIVLALILVTQASMPVAVYAQDKPQQPGRPDVPNLTDAQREQIRQLTQSRRADGEPIIRAYSAARRAKLDAMIATPPDEAKIRAACTDFAKADADMSVFIAKLYNEILPQLTDEQRAWLKDNREALVRYLEMQIQRGLERIEQRRQEGK